MSIKRYIWGVLLCLAQLTIWAQRTMSVGAIVETDSFIWKLDTLFLNEQSTIVKWLVINKTSNTELVISKVNRLIDCNTGKQYDAIGINYTTKYLKKPFTVSRVYMQFPRLPLSSSVIGYFSSNLFYVDSIYSYINESYTKINKYKTPIFNHSVLQSRNDSLAYADFLYDSGIKLFKKRQYSNAIWVFEQALAFENLLYEDWTENMIKTSSTKDWLAHCYYLTGDTKNANKHCRDYIITPYDRRKTKVADSLRYRAFIGMHIKPRVNQTALYEKISELISDALGEKSYRYIESLSELGNEYYENDDYNNAKLAFHRALKILERYYKKDIYLYEDIYEGLAYVSEAEGDYYSAVLYAENALLVKPDTLAIVNEEYYYPFGNNKLVEYYANAGMWEKAIIMQKKKTDYWKERYNESSIIEEDYIMHFRRWNQLLRLSGNTKKSIREMHTFVKTTKVNHIYLNWIIGDIADCFYDLRDYPNARLYYQKINNKFGVAKTFAATGDYWKAIDLLKELIAEDSKHHYIAVDLNIEQHNGPFESYLCYLASYYNMVEQYDSALVQETMHRIPSNYELSLSYQNIGNSYIGKRQWNDAIYYLLKAEDILRIHKRHRHHAKVLTSLLVCYSKANDRNKISHYTNKILEDASLDLLSTFQELTYDERSKYIEEYSDLMNKVIPMYAYYFPSDSIMITAYDASLIMKGALLNSENNVKRVIEESKDITLRNIWDKIKANRILKSKESEKDSIERKYDVDSLRKLIYNLEDSLIIRCKEYGDITQNMKLKWENVRNALHSDEIAIEFLSFPINNDSVIYVALTLRKEFESPKMTILFEKKRLNEVSDSSYYQCKDMTDLVWKPLSSELEGIKNIYFSPTGALYNIGIEYLPGMEKYNIYRVSSTRELVANKENSETGKNAVLYGGLDYDASVGTLSKKKSQTVLDETFKEHADVRGLGLRGGKESLKHTKIEVDNIGNELNKAKWVCLLDTASLGTEESFKSLSGRRINCLHISTHGFYYTKEEADNAQYKFMLLDDKNATTAEDKALTRSGLVMSGANHILEGETLPDNVEDGILTAKEIADVDLRGLDLVVLSACQTGLGDISQGEGVFGVQRGFKKAGANSILMSLWKVEDEATQILMTQFYKNYASGQSKRQSLQSAQKYLRMYKNEKGKQCYNEPRYWAAFILLDGIDKN